MYKNAWSVSDLDNLRKYFETASIYKLEQMLHRQYKTIYAKAKILGLKRLTRNTWSKEELTYLRNNYSKLTKTELLKHIQRPWDRIVSKANRLKIPRHFWNSEELTFLKANYDTLDYDKLALYLDKKKASVVAKANSLGLTKPKAWSKQEELYLIQQYSNKTINELSDILHKSYSSIEHKVARLHLYKKAESSLEKDIEILLKQNNIVYTKQVKENKYRIDFVINGTIALEANGTFWHCDTRHFSNGPVYKQQITCVRRDKQKINYLLSLGYKMVIFWEDDVHSNSIELINCLTAVINGDIDYYDSSKSVKAEMPIPR